MRTVTVVYHQEDGNWWGDSPDPGLETFVVGGRSFAETRRLAWEGIEFHLGEQAAPREIFEDGSPVQPGASVPSVFEIEGPEARSPSTSTWPAPVHLAPPALRSLPPLRALEVA